MPAQKKKKKKKKKEEEEEREKKGTFSLWNQMKAGATDLKVVKDEEKYHRFWMVQEVFISNIWGQVGAVACFCPPLTRIRSSKLLG